MSQKAVILKSVSKKYPVMKTQHKDAKFQDFWALRDVDADIESGQVIGIIGRNGAGKTTLLNIIAGVLSPTEGEVSVSGKVMGLFNLGVGFQDELSGKENIFLNGAILGADRREIESKLDSIIEFSELGNFINMPLGSYSQGMRLRLGFSIIANLDFDILVIDEVLAVGDSLFQSKCFERLMDFRRQSKTLIITSQDMPMIERLCNNVVLLDHGRMIFQGEPKEAINKYRSLLNTEKFFVGPVPYNSLELVENTKKWAEDMSDWGKKLGTKEVIIDSLGFINRFGWRCNRIRTRDPLKIKVSFTARDIVKEPHFGIAIFREDGVYCYGPNTKFDGYYISEIKSGRGSFILSYKNLLLAPGEYRVSVAIWDNKEILAYDYHNGYYKLIVDGYDNINNDLLNIPFRSDSKGYFDSLLDLRLLNYKNSDTIQKDAIKIESVKLFNSSWQEKDVFKTNDSARFNITFNILDINNKNTYLWVGIYRDDGIYCQGTITPLKKRKEFNISFPRLPLLPGGYKVSIGIWDSLVHTFLILKSHVHSFKMIFDRQDHGTVYLEHKWKKEV